MLYRLVLLLSIGCATCAWGQVEGKVTFDGKPPERKPMPGIQNDPHCAKHYEGAVPLDETVIVGKEGGLANAVVFLKGNLKGKAPAAEAVIRQAKCVYVPHVISVTVGQRLVAVNDDAHLHSVHPLPNVAPQVGKAQPRKGDVDVIPTKFADFFMLKCDVHPWMKAWVAVFDHPFHAVTDGDGAFHIDTADLPDGDYEIAVWHEKFKDCATGKVTVKDRKGAVDLKVVKKPDPK